MLPWGAPRYRYTFKGEPTVEVGNGTWWSRIGGDAGLPYANITAIVAAGIKRVVAVRAARDVALGPRFLEINTLAIRSNSRIVEAALLVRLLVDLGHMRHKS